MTYYHKRKLQARQQALDLLEYYNRNDSTEKEKQDIKSFLESLAARTGNTNYFKQKGYI